MNEIGTFTGAGGVQLHYQSWYPVDRPRAALILVHGLGAHSGYFASIVQYFIPLGFAIYSVDLRGHGRSPGNRGYINRWTEFREDVSCLLQRIQAQEPQLPRFLLGHSLGGLVCLEYALRFPSELQGVVAMSPALRQVGVSPLRMALGRVLSWLYPTFSLDTGLELAAISRDLAVLEAYTQDSLRHTKGTARLATEFLAATQWVWQHATELQVPLLILHGSADRITSAVASRAFFEQVTCLDKEYCSYAEGYHDLHNDLIALEVFRDLENWLNHHLTIAIEPMES